MYLQAAGLIEVFSDSIEADPFGRTGSVRLIQCAVVRGYKRANYAVTQGQLSGTMTGRMVRHGTHAMSLAAILEAGGPKGSRQAGEHEFSVPGLYTCPDGELSPLEYGTRARLVMDLSESYEADISPYNKPCTQFVFRGEETVEGDATKKVRSFGEDHQYIYESDDHIAWTELQGWVGVPSNTKGEVGTFKVAPTYDGSRRATRLMPTGPQNQAGLAWTKHGKQELPRACEHDIPVVPPVGSQLAPWPMFMA